MPVKVKKPRSRLRRVLRTAGRALLAAGILLTALYLLRVPLFSGPIARYLSDRLSHESGAVVSIERIEGGWISDATLIGLSWRAPAGSRGLDATCAELRVTYRLWGAWSDPVAALRSVDARDVVVGIDARSGAEPAAADGARPAVREFLDAVPPSLESLRADGAISLLLDAGEAAARRFQLDLTPDRAVLELRQLALPVLGATERSERLAITVRRTTPDVLEASFEGGIAGVRPRDARLDVRSDGTARARVAVEVAGGELQLILDGDALSASCQVDLARLPEWVTRAVPDAPERGTVVAMAHAEAVGERLTLHSAEVRATDVSWRGAVIEESSGNSWRRPDDGALLCAVRARTAGAELRADDAVVDLDAPYGVSAASLALDMPDAARALRALGLEDAATELRGLRTAITFRGALRDARRLEIEALDVRAPRSNLSAAGYVDLPEAPERWRESVLHVDASARAVLEELVPLLPADWELPENRGVLRGAVELRGSPAEPSGSFALAGEGVSVDGRDVQELSASGDVAGPFVRGARVTATTPFGSLNASGDVDFTERRVLDGRLELRAPELETMSETFPALPAMAGSLEVSGTFDGPFPQAEAAGWRERLAGARGDLSATGAGLRIERFDVGALSASGAIDWPLVRVDRLHLEGALASVDLRGTADVVREVGSARGRASIQDLAALARLFPSAPPFAGSLGIEGTLQKEGDSAWRELIVHADLQGRGLRVAEHDVGGVRATVDAAAGNVAVTALRAEGPWGSADAAGSLQLSDGGGFARVERLRIDADAYPPLRDLGVRPGPMELEQPARIEWTPRDVTATDVALTVLGGRASGTLRLGTDEFEASFSGEALDLERLPGGLSGHARLRMQVAGPPTSATGSLDLEVPDLGFAGETGSLILTATQEADGVRVSALSLDLGAAARVSGDGRVPLRLSREGIVEISTAPPPEGQLRAVSERPEAWLDLLGPDLPRVESVEAVARAGGGSVSADVTARNLRWVDATGEFVLSGETRATLRGGSDGLSATVVGAPGGPIGAAGEVRIDAPLDWRQPARALERVRAAPLSGHLDLDAPDLSALAPWVEPLVYAAGRARGRMTLGGTVSVPTWEGVLEGEDLALRLKGDLPTVGDGSLRVTFDEGRIRLERLSAMLGYAPVSATGTLSIQGSQPELDLRIGGENVLLARSPDLRLRADVDLAVSGLLDNLLVEGSVKITDALYSRAMDLLGGRASGDKATQLFSFREPPLSEMRFDVRVLAEETLRIENNVLDGAFSVDLRLRGTGAVPEPEGRIEFRDVGVTLPLTRLRVERGSVDFPPGSPFDPRVRASASTRLKGYDLTVQLTGPVAATRVQVASSPALSQEDALLLLATGATPQELANDGVQGVALGKAGALLGGTMLAWMSGPSDPDATALAERITVEFGREQSRSGASTIDAELMLSERWYLRFERDRYDDYNAGVVWRFRFK